MKSITLLFVMLTLISCSSQKKDERDVEAKAKMTNVSDSKGLGTTIRDLIHSSKTLTEAQKKELEEILVANKQKAESLSEQSYKYRAVLVKELLSGNINQNEVKILKKDIKKVESLRLKNTFDTVEKITNIVSSHPDNHVFADHLIMMERSH